MKGRSNKRSSNSSYTSTVTTIIFIALCVLGVWMLTSNSVIPSQTTARIDNSENSENSATENPLQKEPKNSAAFEDNPGQLPEDAIQPDENKPKENQEIEETQRQQATEEIQENPKQEAEQENGNDDKNKNNNNEVNPISEDSTTTTTHVQDLDLETSQDTSSNENQQANSDQANNSEQKEKQKKGKKKHRRKKDLSEEDVHEGTSHDQAEHDNQKPQETSPVSQSKNKDKDMSDTNVDRQRTIEKPTQSNTDGSYLGGANTGIPKESQESTRSWSTQADQSVNQKERGKGGSEGQGYTWQLCNVTAGTDYIPCLDNEKAINKLHSRRHYEHRERHCPEKGPTCLVVLPEGYKTPIGWPNSRDKIWYHNVPHPLLADVKGHQNWVKVSGEFLTFPGGGTQFIHGALHYIDFVQEAVPDIAWGKRTRVILDVGCGVASFGGFLFERDVLAMSFAPKDEHEAQVQFALERGIPAISAVMGTQRLQFPSMVFDLVHCARCRVPWHADGGALLLELNRVLRPGGYFVWSATPVYQKEEEDVEIWKEMTALTKSMCWELVAIKRDKLNSVGVAVYHKPTSNECYDQREKSTPPICKVEDDPNAAWYVNLQSCMHRVPEKEAVRGSKWPERWPLRVETPPYWLNKSQMGIYGKPAPDDFETDYEHWKGVVSNTYLNGLGISWDNVRNVMDMRAVYGGFAAALKDKKLWVMNVVNVDSPDTLPIIYERGLFGIYHDWCESFSTYPRTYDLLHADHLFSKLRKRCSIEPVMAEIDRIVRPGGKLIVRDESSAVGQVENLLKSLHWEVHLTFLKNQEGILSATKSNWRPESYTIPS